MKTPLIQNMLEWRAFMALLRTHPVRRVLEIGSFYGGSLEEFMTLCSDGVFVSIDLPVPVSDPRYARMRECRTQWQGWADASRHELVDIEGDSHARDILARAALHAPFDLTFIDGDHSYPGVSADWRDYSPLTKPGGLVVFHDVVHNPNVARLWAEIQGFKLMLSAGPAAPGIGVYFVPIA